MTTPAMDTGDGVHPRHPSPHSDPALALPAPRRSYTAVWIALAVLLLLLIVGISSGIVSRSVTEHHLEQTTARDAVLSVNVIHPAVTGTASTIALPGNTQAFDDTPIYARTNGYLKAFYVDIGQHVRKGELIAVIQTPEIDEQLQVAQANLKSSQADLNLANTTSERYQNLLKEDSVSKQETDVAVSGAAARKAAVEAAEANVRRLQELQSFERVYAPFDGVVTARNTDIGALIDAGSGSAQPRDLFRIASINRLRVFVPVPEVYAPAIQNGETAGLTLDEYPGQQFQGTVARNSSAIDINSRTLNVEVDVNNIGGKLLPGSYVFVHFKLPQAAQMVSVPANTLLFRAEGLRAGVVRNGHVHLQPVTIGRDNGSSLEIATGLNPSDNVIVNPADSLAEGQSVRVSNTATSTAEAP
ncbi:MAG: efflux RND transporter periplasmic adaptor subunit [Janthinobacterium lividum]